MNSLRHPYLLRVIAIATLCVMPISAEVPQAQITELDQALATTRDESSPARKRLAVKRTIRDAEALLKSHPTAPNRFVLLDILFRARQELVKLENDPENRAALLETCKQLAAAPDEFAALRFDADLLLSQSESARTGADAKTRAKALLPLVQRYRGTPAETKAIRVAIVIAIELGDSQIAESLRAMIDQRHAGDLEMIEFQRANFGGQVIGAPFSGAFEAADGSSMRFPMDGIGKATLLFFWSNDEAGKKHLAALASAWKEYHLTEIGRIQVVSFNLDNLPDAGQSILQDLGVAWPALKLPGGRENPYFRTFAARSPAAVSLSPTGHAALILQGSTRNNSGNNSDEPAEPDYTDWFTRSLRRSWTAPTYMSQLAALQSGELFLHTGSTLPSPFLPPIRRYHTPNADLIPLYQSAADQCEKSIQENPTSSDLPALRNQLITALNSLHHLTNDRAHLTRALAESNAALAANPPAADKVIPLLCLTRQALRASDAKPREMIGEFLKSLGGETAPATALAAAALLALESADRELHESLRTTLLSRHADDPTIHPVTALLLDRYHRYWLYEVPFTAGWSFGRREKYFLSLGEPEPTKRSFTVDFKTLDGTTVSIPQAYPGKWIIALIPSTEVGEKPPLQTLVTNHLRQFTNLTTNRPTDDVQIVTALLDDDAKRIAATYNAAEIPCPLLKIPGGITHPLVTRLGLLNEPSSLNALLLRPDGTIAAALSTLTAGHTSQTLINLIEWQDEQNVSSALARGDLEEAKRLALLHAPTAPPDSTDPKKKNIKPPPISLPHLRSRARVHLALKDYPAALADAEEIVAQQLEIDGGMSLRTRQLDEAEDLRDQIRELLAPSK